MSQNFATNVAKPSTGVGVAMLNLDSNGNLKVTLESAPTQAPVANSSGNVAAAAAVATLPAAAGKTTYITGFDVTGAGATAASVVTVALTGVLDGPLDYTFAVPEGATVGATPLSVRFNPPLPASAVDTAIVVTAPSFGTGNTNAAASAYGYQQ